MLWIKLQGHLNNDSYQRQTKKVVKQSSGTNKLADEGFNVNVLQMTTGACMIESQRAVKTY